MSVIDQSSPGQATIPGQHARIVASLELSPKKWLVTSLSPGSEKLSKRWIDGGDGEGLLALLRELQAKAERRVGGPVKVVSIYEAGLDGFWLHRLLELTVSSHVVDAGSIAAPRRKRRAKSDGIDGETLIRVLLAWLRREPRVCSMVRPPSIEEEDRRRLNREREALVRERTRETNRMRGLLMSQGVRDFNPLRRGARECLAGLTTGDGRPLPPRLLADLGRILDRITLLVAQIAEVEAASGRALAGAGGRDPAALLPQLRSLGQETTAVLAFEGFWRRFANRRQIGAYAGLAATPWRSGQPRTNKASAARASSAPAQGDGPARLAVAAPPAALGLEPLVSPARRQGAGPRPPHRHRRARPQAAGRALALRHPGHHPRGCGAQERLRGESAQKFARTDQPRRRGVGGPYARMTREGRCSRLRCAMFASISDLVRPLTGDRM